MCVYVSDFGNRTAKFREKVNKTSIWHVVLITNVEQAIFAFIDNDKIYWVKIINCKITWYDHIPVNSILLYLWNLYKYVFRSVFNTKGVVFH